MWFAQVLQVDKLIGAVNFIVLVILDFILYLNVNEMVDCYCAHETLLLIRIRRVYGGLLLSDIQYYAYLWQD